MQLLPYKTWDSPPSFIKAYIAFFFFVLPDDSWAWLIISI